MKNITRLLIIVLVVVVLTFAAILKTPLLKYPVSLYFSYALKSDVSIKKCSLSFREGLRAEGVEIRNKKGLYCSIKDTHIKGNFFGLLKREFFMDCSLKSVKFSYSTSEIINGIAKLFAIEPAQLLEFDTVDGGVYIKPNQIIIKNLKAPGRNISLFADGTTTDNKYIDYTFKLILSENITSEIPEAIQKFFFKKDQGYSVVELYLSGNIKKPSINFSTSLFKLRIK